MLRRIRRVLSPVIVLVLLCGAVYVCRAQDGYVSFFRDGVLSERTQIPVSALPQADAAAIGCGIYTPSVAGCTKMAEDFCS